MVRLDHDSVPMSNSSVRDALVVSVTKLAPPVNFQMSQLSTVPTAIRAGTVEHAVLEPPAELGPAEVRVQHEAGAPAYEREMALRHQRAAILSGTAILPDDGPGLGPAGRARPRHHRLAGW